MRMIRKIYGKNNFIYLKFHFIPFITKRLTSNLAIICGNRKKAICSYINTLKLGYTKSLKDIYRTTVIEFYFSADYVKDLAKIIKSEK
tara:strand:- start:135 stop:398 length:264 start_codon:yes stop_codon:yes gene_type:complete